MTPSLLQAAPLPLFITWDDVKHLELILGLLATIGAGVYLLFRLFFEHKHMKKALENQALTEAGRHEELLLKLAAHKKEEEQARDLLETRIENHRLRDKEESQQQFAKVFDTLGVLTTGMAQLQTSSGHILDSLTKIQDAQGKQAEINLKIFEHLAAKK